MAQEWIISIFIVLSCLTTLVKGHARLLNPPSRASKWRLGFSMPAADYDDNQGYCGGRSRLWNEFGGQCGVCGDAFYPIPRAHERGGRYYTGEITKTFKQGDIIEADVEVTANHRGFFEFKICPYDNPESEDIERDQNGEFIEVTQRCLDKHPIPLADGSGYKYFLPSPFKRGIHTAKLRLPFNLVCQKCLFQWKYNTGNSWGKSHNGSDCMGCGHQEQFYSCADVKITAAAHLEQRPPPTRSPQPSATSWPWDQAKEPSFWTQMPGVPGWRQNPAFPTTTTTTTTTTTPKPRFWPWWFFNKNEGWFNRDAWSSTTHAPSELPSDEFDDWTNRPRTTRMPFWNRWFFDKTTEASPPNAPLVPAPKQQTPKRKQSGFWERLFSRVRQNFWTWFFKGKTPGLRKTGRNRPKLTRKTTTTTTTTTPRTTTKSRWWKWWESNRSKTTTPAPVYRSWWESWPWARVWDKKSPRDEDTSTRSRSRWRTRITHRTRPTTTTTTTTTPRRTTRRNYDWEYEQRHNRNKPTNHRHNNMANVDEDHEEISSEVAQTSYDECYPVGIWTTLPGMKKWCILNCAAGFCPEGYCSEGCKD